MVSDDGNRNVPYANQNGKSWDDNWNYLDNDFNSNGRIAVSSNLQNVIYLLKQGGFDSQFVGATRPASYQSRQATPKGRYIS